MSSNLVYNDYLQAVSKEGELNRAKLCKRLLDQIADLNTATENTGKINFASALSTAQTAVDNLIGAIED